MLTRMIVLVSLLVFGLAGAAAAGPGWAPPAPGPAPMMEPILVADPLDNVEKIAGMEPSRLLVLGLGIVSGATLIAPTLGMSELVGVALGAIAAEYIYRTYIDDSRPWWPW